MLIFISPMVADGIDFNFLLIENYKKIGITDLELATIIVMDHLISQGNPMITADLLALKMAMPVKDIDKTLASLLKKKFIDYIIHNKKTITTLEPLRQRLYKEFQYDMANETKHGEEMEKQLSNIYVSFEDLLGRALSPVELSKIKEWISYGYSDETIINALKDALSKGKKTLRSVDKILLAWATRDDIEKEGVSSISDSWHKNIEETIKIAQTPWLDDENKH